MSVKGIVQTRPEVGSFAQASMKRVVGRSKGKNGKINVNQLVNVGSKIDVPEQSALVSCLLKSSSLDSQAVILIYVVPIRKIPIFSNFPCEACSRFLAFVAVAVRRWKVAVEVLCLLKLFCDNKNCAWAIP